MHVKKALKSNKNWDCVACIIVSLGDNSRLTVSSVLTVGNERDRAELGVFDQHVETDPVCTCSSREVAGNTPRTVRHHQQTLQHNVIQRAAGIF